MNENEGVAVYQGHSVVEVETTEGERRNVCTCQIGPDDVTDDGRVRWPTEKKKCNRTNVWDDSRTERPCQTTDSAIVVDGQTVPINSLSIEHGGVEGVSVMEGHRATYEFSFTVSFEDEEEARKFREFFS